MMRLRVLASRNLSLTFFDTTVLNLLLSELEVQVQGGDEVRARREPGHLPSRVHCGGQLIRRRHGQLADLQAG